MAKIQLGDEVRDKVTGFKGIAVGVTKWLTGCDRYVVQPRGVNKDGKIYENQSFDEGTLEVVKTKAIKEGKHDTGGPSVYGETSKY
jgi:hypothetical protein